MTLLPLEVKCEHCSKQHVRQVSVMEPEAFSDRGTKSILSQFWCPKCGEVNAVRYEFFRDSEQEVQVRLKARAKPIGMAFKHGDEDED